MVKALLLMVDVGVEWNDSFDLFDGSVVRTRFVLRKMNKDLEISRRL